MASVMNTGSVSHYEPNEQGLNGSANNVAVTPSGNMRDDRAILPSISMTSSTSSRRSHQQQKQQQHRQRSNSRSTSSSTPVINNNDNNYGADDLLQSSTDHYDSLLQTGMELADELCMALNTCFKGGFGNVVSSSSNGGGYDRGDSDNTFSETIYKAGSAASAAFDAAASEMDRTSSRFFEDRSNLEEESTIVTRSTYNSNYDDEGTYNTQSVYTTDSGNDQLTAFNTMSSFRNRRESEDDSPKNGGMKGGNVKSARLSNRSSSPKTTVTTRSDPPPRMLV